MSDGDFIIFADVTVVADVTIVAIVVVFSTLTDSPFQLPSSIAIRSIASSESFEILAETVFAVFLANFAVVYVYAILATFHLFE